MSGYGRVGASVVMWDDCHGEEENFVDDEGAFGGSTIITDIIVSGRVLAILRGQPVDP